MREILFRGKRWNSEWVYGYYAHQFGAHEILSRDGDEYQHESYHINPVTVGQYTGLTDKNGKKIFEGDIVETFSEDGYGLVCYDNIETEFGLKFYSYNSYSGLGRDYMSREIEIIGNIHDNPELLERS